MRGLQSRQVLGITNRGKRDYKQGQLKGFQIGAKRLQIRARILNRGKEISNRGRNLTLGQERLQIGAGIKNRGKDCKSVKNNFCHVFLLTNIGINCNIVCLLLFSVQYFNFLIYLDLLFYGTIKLTSLVLRNF